MEEILSRIRKIHLIGVGGAGMSGLAMLLKDKGYLVSGSDVKESFYFGKVKEAGIEVFLGHSERNLDGVELVCYSSAIREDNIEIMAAKKRGIPLVKRGKLLGEISKDKKVIAVSGSHGKTTTSALLTHLLNSLGYQPSTFIGAQPLGYSKSSWWGKDFFVIEIDESDGTILNYYPWIAIITNIDNEHIDFYGDRKNLDKAFREFAYRTKELVIGWADLEPLKSIIQEVNSLKYGYTSGVDLFAKEINFDGEFTSFSLTIKDKNYSKVKIPLIGEHNVLNALAVIAFFYYLGEDMDKVFSAFISFKGTKRRFEVKDRIEGIAFLEDYAHHPTEVKATIKSAKLLKPERLVVIFQPHRYSRLSYLYQEFAQSFSLCDVLILTDIYSAGEVKPPGFDDEILWKELKQHFNKKCFYFPKDHLVEEVLPLLKEGDLVLALGAGDINILLNDIIEEFKRNKAKVLPS
ncbi:MAG: UDP-N-acetylmuramate--L-alanine ligase [Candidatus Omnitrophota bacterium]|nr:MAG: UDP-N-acetylmuramate--L-alanine ligase [Candidatus Omnitrophota bacterium]